MGEEATAKRSVQGSQHDQPAQISAAKRAAEIGKATLQVFLVGLVSGIGMAAGTGLAGSLASRFGRVARAGDVVPFRKIG